MALDWSIFMGKTSAFTDLIWFAQGWKSTYGGSTPPQKTCKSPSPLQVSAHQSNNHGLPFRANCIGETPCSLDMANFKPVLRCGSFFIFPNDWHQNNLHRPILTNSHQNPDKSDANSGAACCTSNQKGRH